MGNRVGSIPVYQAAIDEVSIFDRVSVVPPNLIFDKIFSAALNNEVNIILRSLSDYGDRTEFSAGAFVFAPRPYFLLAHVNVSSFPLSKQIHIVEKGLC